MLMNHIDPGGTPKESQESAKKARPYLVMALVCAVYLLAVHVMVSIMQGFDDATLVVHLIGVCAFISVILVLKNIPKSLALLGITGKIYFVLFVVIDALSLSSGAAYLDYLGAWKIVVVVLHLASALYLAMADMITALRIRASLPPLRTGGILIRAFSIILPLVLVFSAYIAFITTIVPKEVRKLRSIPYQELRKKYDNLSIDAYEWNDKLNLYLKKDMTERTLDELDDMEVFLWRNDHGDVTSYSVDPAFALGLSEKGVGYGYGFNKKIWNADWHQPILLILKAIGINEGTTVVYHLETEKLSAIIITVERENGRGYTRFHAFPKDGPPYDVFTMSPTPAGAAEPVILSVERLLEE